jgi:1-aminocyclopropane-1-carboxylate deaminase/D-cysteine desulfhydrase-like pyridoxal-dependent ACC family enzyme
MMLPVDFPGRERALAALEAVPAVRLAHYPTPVESLERFANALGARSRLVVKRDDAIAFGFGGNKVRKVELVAAQAIADGADTLITTGGVQSNHARVTAAAAAKLGLRCVLVLNGTPPARLAANALLDHLFGAEVRYVERREERAPAMRKVADQLRAEGHHPVEIPLGASTPLGALGLARAISELVSQNAVPDVIVHSTSSGGTQSGLLAGCMLHGLHTRVVGISADTPSGEMKAIVGDLLRGIADHLGVAAEALAGTREIEVDDRFVGEGYGIPTEASRDAAALLARTEALVVDDTYTAKALAGLIAWIREGRLREGKTVMFWHTGGQVGIFT